MVRLGIDVGSTTVKIVAVNEQQEVLFSRYARHNAKPSEVLQPLLDELTSELGEVEATLHLTGSVGMGIAERSGLPFVQEVVAASAAVQASGLQVNSMIDIGGEDAKVVFFADGQARDLRMNGNCAGGTGAFIDQMALILGVTVDELAKLAEQATQVYPIASRCGVFCKTDIQNLIARNATKADIAASIFRAVSVQTVVTLARGCDITPPVLLCGGPLTFIPALREAFRNYLGLQDEDMLLPENSGLWPALGAALSTAGCGEEARPLTELLSRLITKGAAACTLSGRLAPVFRSEAEHQAWEKENAAHDVPRRELPAGPCEAWLGIDSGSTTTKIVLTDANSRLLFSWYAANGGNPIRAVERGLQQLAAACEAGGTELSIKGSCSTGYGEDLIRAAFGLNCGIVETIAHYRAACHFLPEVSFILDIGGQDMKAIFVQDGVINRIEINEACSSGCGSFIETFAQSLGSDAPSFARAACRAKAPCELGTRCTVFMNSKVKQALREGASVEDVAAGLAYSVVKNCLYKVLKLKEVSTLGKCIVVQGGTMHNDAVMRALELQTGQRVTRCNIPELMGAYGCALYAMEQPGRAVTLPRLLANASYTTRTAHCTGCDNQCAITAYRFGNGRSYYSGNRCERIFSNGATKGDKGENAWEFKNKLLFERPCPAPAASRPTVGIPRCLNMFEEYPFWHSLFSACGIGVRLSSPSRFAAYEQHARLVMADNICFPAKLVHSHVQELVDARVDRIFMPLVIHEAKGGEQNSYNCPIVTGYAEVVKGVQAAGIPLDSPPISFKDKKLLSHQCCRYLHSLGVGADTARMAVERALLAQAEFTRQLEEENERILREARQYDKPVLLLAGRPYHADPLVQHRISGLLAGMGIHIITDDIARSRKPAADDGRFLAQWAFPNRLLRAADWCGEQTDDIPMVLLTSFGCGPDAFLADELRERLMRKGKVFTLMKLDDINNVGSMKLRARSLLESMKQARRHRAETAVVATLPAFTHRERKRKILVPYFTPFVSPIIPAMMKAAGYEVECLPESDKESIEWGLRYANNEVCYPATLIVGDFIRAFRSGGHKPSECAIGMFQTGGQCRASNYVALIRKALIDAGYTDVPIVSLTYSSLRHSQPGFRLNWPKHVPAALRGLLFSDCICRLYYATAVREKLPGMAIAVRDRFLAKAAELLAAGRSSELVALVSRAAVAFREACMAKELPRVGVVGEIYLKFNPFAQRGISDWLMKQGVEVIPPTITEFFLQAFVNRQANVEALLERSFIPDWIVRRIYARVSKLREEFNEAASGFPWFLPMEDIYAGAEAARSVISLNIQFGEGWLLPAEILSYLRQGITNVVSLQPFGCIANQIVSKGMEKRLKAIHPELNLLSLDFDSGVCEVNITNRLLLFTSQLSASHPFVGEPACRTHRHK